MRRSTKLDDTGYVSMDRANVAGQTTFAGAGYRLAAGGLGRRWTPSGEAGKEPCLEDEFVAHTARAWTRLRGAAAQLPDATRTGMSVAAGQVDRVPFAMVCQATALCAVAAIGASTVLYWQKSRTAQVDHEIGHVVGEMAQTEAQTGRLRAQWLALNDPARLQDAASRYSGLRPLAPTQFVDAGKLADHLPVPGAVPSESALETAPENTPETVIAGDASPIFKPITAQAASAVMPAPPVQPALPAVPVPPMSAQASAEAGPVQSAGAGSATAETAAQPAAAGTAAMEPPPAHGALATQPTSASASAPVPVPHAAAQAGFTGPGLDDTWDAPRIAAPHPHAAPALRLAAAMRTPLRPAIPTIIYAAGGAFRVAPPMARPDLKPRPMPRMLMARFDMPHWLMETRPIRPSVTIMSAQPHALSAPRDYNTISAPRDYNTLSAPRDNSTLSAPRDNNTISAPRDARSPGAPHASSVLLPGRRGEAALRVRSEEHASADEETSEPEAVEEPRPAPTYRPYYGGYGYGGPYQAAPRAYYPNPYGGYSSQAYRPYALPPQAPEPYYQ